MCDEKLTICYNAWMIFNEDDDYDEQVRQIAERGFNCIRLEYGAGLLWDDKGKIRDDVLVSSPFGKYTKFTTYRVIVERKRLNLLERFLRICKAAKKYEVKLIISTWFFLHTNWFYAEKETKPIFDLSTREKFSFFANELSKILKVLKDENLIDIIAFAEIFNEYDGLDFVKEASRQNKFEKFTKRKSQN